MLERFLFERFGERFFGAVPMVHRPDVFLGPRGKCDVIVLETKCFQNAQGEVNNFFHLWADLVRPAEDVRVILRKAAHAHEAMHHAASLISIHRPHLRDSNRQLAVGVQRVLIDLDVSGTIHRLQQILRFIDLDRGKHVLPVEIPMAGGFPKLELRDMRRHNELVAVFLKERAQVFIDEVAQSRALGQPEDESGANRVREDREKPEFRPQFAVIALFGFL